MRAVLILYAQYELLEAFVKPTMAEEQERERGRIDLLSRANSFRAGEECSIQQLQSTYFVHQQLKNLVRKKSGVFGRNEDFETNFTLC